MIRLVGSLARYVLPCVILGWFVYRLWSTDDQQQQLLELWHSADNWPQFALSIATYLMAVMGTFFRWYLLVVALHLPFRVRDALRLGFIGYLLQFVSLGSVGGDVFKAVFIAREQPNRRPEAVATVLIDRLTGLLGLIVLSSVVFAVVDAEQLGQLAILKPICFWLAIVGITVFALILGTGIGLHPIIIRTKSWPVVCATLMRVQSAVDIYRARSRYVMAAVGIGIGTHFLHALAIFLAARSFFPNGPGLFDQLVLWVVGGTVAAVPVAPGGLGTFDAAYSSVYEMFAGELAISNEGLLVAILFRVMCLVAAAIGIIIFWSCRREIRDLAETNG